MDGIEKHLSHKPLNETRNRKPLRPNPIAPYDIISDEPRIVKILAIGYKKGHTLYIGGETMKIIDLDKASKPLSEYTKENDKEIVILKSKDKPVAAIVSLKNVDMESISLSTNPEFLEIIENSRKEFKMGGKISFDEMKNEIAKM